MNNRVLSWVIVICMIMTLLQGEVLAGTVEAPQPPENLKISIGEYYQTRPTLKWDEKDYDCEYGVHFSRINTVNIRSNNWIAIEEIDLEQIKSKSTEESWQYQLNGSNDVVELKTIVSTSAYDIESEYVRFPYTMNFMSTKKAPIDVTKFVKDSDENYTTVLYTIKGLPASSTANLVYTDNPSEGYRKKILEINAEGVLVFEELIPNTSTDPMEDDSFDRYLIVYTDPAVNETDKIYSVNQQIYPLNKAITPTYQHSQTLTFDQNQFDEYGGGNYELRIEQGKSKQVLATNSAGTEGGSILYYSSFADYESPKVLVNPTTGVVTATGEVGDIWWVHALAGSTQNPDGTGNYAPASNAYMVRIVADVGEGTYMPPSDMKFELDSQDRYATLPLISRKDLDAYYPDAYISYVTESEYMTDWSGLASSPLATVESSMFIDKNINDEWVHSIKQYTLYNEFDVNGETMYSEEVPFDCDVTITNKYLDELTATYNTNIENIDGEDKTVYTYTVSDLPLERTTVFMCTSDIGMRTGIDFSHSEDGTLIFQDYVTQRYPSGRFGLATDTRDKDLAVYVTAFTNPTISGTKVSFTQETHKLNFIQDDGLVAQDIVWDTGDGGIATTYGTDITGKKATNLSTGGGGIIYSSSDTSVATVNSSTGELTIIGAGEAKITATASKVEGTYRESAITYPLTVHKKNITAKVDTKTKVFGEANPELTYTISNTDLVGDDVKQDLGINLSTAATVTSDVGEYTITGSTSSNNYFVKIEPAILTITKALAPNIKDTVRTLYYAMAYTNLDIAIATLPQDCGTISVVAGAVTGDEAMLDGDVQTTDMGLKLSTHAGSVGDSIAIPITVSMQNYEDIHTKVIITLVDKTLVTITGVEVESKKYDANAIAAVGKPVGTYNDENTPIIYTGDDFQFIWRSGATTLSQAPKDTGEYSLTVKIPDTNAQYIGQLGPMNFTITPAALTIKPADLKIYNGADLPTPTDIDYIGLKGQDTKAVVKGYDSMPAIKIYQADGVSALTSSTVNGTYPIKFVRTPSSLSADNYTITVTSGALTITTKSSGDSGGGGGSVGGGSTPAIGDEKEVQTSVTSTVKNRRAQASVDSNMVTKALEKIAKGATIAFNVENTKNVDAVTVQMKNQSIKALADSKTGLVTIASEVGIMDIEDKTLESIAKQAGTSDISINLGKVDKDKELNAKQKAVIGEAPVYDISIKAGDAYISDFDGGLLTLSIPYTLKEGEEPSGIVVWYVDDYGNIKKVSTMYDVKTKHVIFTTNHLSLYAIGYDQTKTWVNPFDDVYSTAWYFEAIRYVNANKLMAGVTKDTFDPEGDMTRAMIITILYRLEKEPAVDTNRQQFSDVDKDTWYSYAITWAFDNGIIKGYDNNKFGPMDCITREQMSVILMNYAKYKNINTTQSRDISSFTDSSQISDWALEAMQWAYQEGLISGKANNTLDARAKASRAEAAMVLKRFMEE